MHQRTFWHLVMIAVWFLLLSPPANAARWDLNFRLCREDLFAIPRIIQVKPIPIGCEVIDCCPGCPGPGPLNWSIRLAGAAADAVILQFDNLPPEASEHIEVEGDAERMENNSFLIKPGQSLLTNLPLEHQGLPPVGFAILAVNQENLEGRQKRQEPPPSVDFDVDFDIVQRLGQTEVNSFRLRSVPCIGCCLFPPPGGDLIDLTWIFHKPSLSTF